MRGETAAGKVHVGIGGWNYPPWRGTFYPEGLRQKDELAWASQRLTATEVNATFYRSQSAKTFAAWAAATPDDFRFALKGSRYVTNRRELGEAGESVARFVGSGIAALGDKLGPINWQLPPHKRFDPDEIAAFLALLPDSVDGLPLRHAIEVRHESFADPAFGELTRAAGVAVIHADHETYPCLDHDAGGFRYARLMRTVEELPAGYADDALDRFAALARRWADAGQDVWMFFIGGAKVRAPAAAQALIARVGEQR